MNALEKTQALQRAGVADLGTVPLETIELQMSRVEKQKRINKWPNATVPYDFDTNFCKSCFSMVAANINV